MLSKIERLKWLSRALISFFLLASLVVIISYNLASRSLPKYNKSLFSDRIENNADIITTEKDFIRLNINQIHEIKYIKSELMKCDLGIETEAYLKKTGKNILSSVGCYQVEKLGPQIIKSINGDFFNVLGFPLFPFLTFLSKR